MTEQQHSSIDDYDSKSSVKKRLLFSMDQFEVIQQDIKNNSSHFAIDLAKIKATGQLVSLKRIREGIPQDEVENLYQSIISEYCIICEFSHPAIIFAVGLYKPNDKSKVVLVLPYYKNGSLHDFIQNNPQKLSLEIKIIILFGIAAGMTSLHDLNICHRNLNPNNILIDDNFYPIIYNYGISPNFDPSAIEEFTGNVNYFSPEQVSGEPFTKHSDIYSYGLIVNELFTKEIPYNGLKNVEICDMITSGKLPRIAGEHDEIFDFFSRLIKKCLNKDPKKRLNFKKIFKMIKSEYDEFPIDSSLVDPYKRTLSDSSIFSYSNFKIPVPILKLPDDEHPWTSDSPSPINFEELEKIFSKASNHPIILIMLFGQFQSGKSTFLKTLTGNSAFYPGKGTQSTTLGLMFDGPYFVSELIDQINETFSDIKDECLKLKIDNDPAIYFIDSQGIGDEGYETAYKPVLDKVLSMFLSITLISITISDFNQKKKDMENTLRAIRRGQLSSSIKGSHVFFLVKKYDKSLDNLLVSSSIESFNEAKNKFTQTWISEHNLASEQYFPDSITALPLGDCNNFRIYLNTVYYSFYYILLKMKSVKSYYKRSFIGSLSIESSGLFNISFSELCKQISNYSGEKSIFAEVKDKGIYKYWACCQTLGRYISYFMSNSLESNTEIHIIEQNINMYLCIALTVIFPYIIGNDNIPCQDFLQYSYEIYNDIMSYFKKNSPIIQNYIKKAHSKKKKPHIDESIGSISTNSNGALDRFSFWFFNQLQKSPNNEWKDHSIASLYPYLWEKNLFQISYSEINIMKQKKRIVPGDENLFIFFEQNNNNSKLLFQALTGIEIKPKKESEKAFLFQKIESKNVINRFRRCHKQKQTELSNKIHFIYLKNISQEELSHLESTQGKKTIYITSIIDGQNMSISPNDTKNLYVFYLSNNFFHYKTVTKESFKRKVNAFLIHFRKIFLNQAIYLPIYAENLDFINQGPRCQASIKYASRYILKDPALYMTKEEHESYLKSIPADLQSFFSLKRLNSDTNENNFELLDFI